MNCGLSWEPTIKMSHFLSVMLNAYILCVIIMSAITLTVVIMSVIKLSVIILSIILLSIVMLSVVSPLTIQGYEHFEMVFDSLNKSNF